MDWMGYTHKQEILSGCSPSEWGRVYNMVQGVAPAIYDEMISFPWGIALEDAFLPLNDTQVTCQSSMSATNYHLCPSSQATVVPIAAYFLPCLSTSHPLTMAKYAPGIRQALEELYLPSLAFFSQSGTNGVLGCLRDKPVTAGALRELKRSYPLFSCPPQGHRKEGP